MRKFRYYYYFRPSLSTHLHFFEAWVNAVNSYGTNMELLTFLPLSQYRKEYRKIKQLREKGYYIYPDFKVSIIPFFYFFYQSLFCNIIIIHLKKRSPKPFDVLKIIFPNKVKYIIEGEGDPQSEMDYLIKHPYKEGFYDRDIKNLKQASFEQKKIFKNADLITFGYQAMKDMLVKRYSDLGLDKKIVLVPMSPSRNSLYYSDELREKTRTELELRDELVFTYIGNVYYSWQNFYDTLRVIKLFKRTHPMVNIFSIFLISQSTQDIARDIISECDFLQERYLLKSVENSLMINYLNAADIGIALRSDQVMNKTTPPGKILDYLCCGLPVITTKYLGEISDYVESNKFGAVLDDINDDNTVIEKINPYIHFDSSYRQKTSQKANSDLTIEKYIKSYVDYINILIER